MIKKRKKRNNTIPNANEEAEPEGVGQQVLIGDWLHRNWCKDQSNWINLIVFDMLVVRRGGECHGDTLVLEH